MSRSANNPSYVSPIAKRMRMMLENYVKAKEEGTKEGFDIANVTENNYEHYYVLFKPLVGLYRDQYHILEIKTTYGNGSDQTQYPMHAPYVKFATAVHHTNISSGGAICLDILKESDKWSPLYDIASIIRSILLLFASPNNASPFNGTAASDYVACEKRFKELKTSDMTVGDEEKLTELCFKQFKDKADKVANANAKVLREMYSKWFPQLAGGVSVDNLQDLKDMLESLKPKKKEVVAPVAVDSAVNSSSASSTDSSSASSTSAKKVIDLSRFAKYQKK